MDDRNLLTQAERQEFRELEDMFGSAGWRHIATRLREEIEHGPAYWFHNAQSWDQILAARARIRAVVELLNYETTTENRKANLIEGRKIEQQDNQADESLEYF